MFYNFLKGFAEIPPSDFDLIIRSAREKKIEAKEVLLKEGAVAKELFFVLDGILKIVSTSEKGNEVIQFFMKEDRFCTILYSFNGNTPSHEGIVAATDAKVLVFSKPALNDLYRKLPWFEQLIEDITHRALLDKIKIRNNLMGEEAAVRYQKFASQQQDILLRVPLGDVASYLGITQQSLSRIRRNSAG